MMKKIAIWKAILANVGKGTPVSIPKYLHMGWKSQIWGSSTVKWERRTILAQRHCSSGVGILFCEGLLVGEYSYEHTGRELYLLNFVFSEVRYGINDDPRQRAPKIN